MIALSMTALTGVIFGLALAAPPGPMNAIIAEESAVRGWTAGFLAGLGAMTADIIFFVLAAFGVITIVERAPLLRAGMITLGGVLMLYFAYGAATEIHSAFGISNTNTGTHTLKEDNSESGSKTTQKNTNLNSHVGTGFRKAFILALTNPYQILFWLTIGVGLLQSGTLDILAQTPYIGSLLTGLVIVETGSPTLIIGFFIGIIIWITGFPASLVRIGRRVNKLAPVVAGGSAIVLAGFGMIFILRGVRKALIII
ncbi:LysE family transport protein [Haloquadratum walsbyi DSM 16790]|uniref:LysE family transport protein n=2 Tax=Haloquadratum walsbyi TaxID=293091 RepID=Q18JW5_HALWD|nr:LysE family transport protein [Haloquadratum walsbyi DSM 16790]